MKDEELQEFTKELTEKYVISFDYTNKLPSGTALTSAVLSAYDLNTQAIDNTVLNSTTGTISGYYVKAQVLGGVAGHRYKITTVTTLDDSFSKLEDEIIMKVKDL